MENSQLDGNQDGKEPQKGHYQSVPTLIAKMRLAFKNAKEPEILDVMNTVGITESVLDRYLADLDAIENLDQTQNKEYGEQYAETQKFDKQREAIDVVYMRHRNLAKIAFKKDLKDSKVLGLDEGRKRAYPAWLQLVKNFYAQLSTDDTLQEKVAAINIKDNDIAVQQQAIAQLEALKVSQKKETAEAQKATETRDAALDALYPKYRDFVDYAVELFGDDQTLEKLGIVVRR